MSLLLEHPILYQTTETSFHEDQLIQSTDTFEGEQIVKMS